MKLSVWFPSPDPPVSVSSRLPKHWLVAISGGSSKQARRRSPSARGWSPPAARMEKSMEGAARFSFEGSLAAIHKIRLLGFTRCTTSTLRSSAMLGHHHLSCPAERGGGIARKIRFAPRRQRKLTDGDAIPRRLRDVHLHGRLETRGAETHGHDVEPILERRHRW